MNWKSTGRHSECENISCIYTFHNTLLFLKTCKNKTDHFYLIRSSEICALRVKKLQVHFSEKGVDAQALARETGQGAEVLPCHTCSGRPQLSSAAVHCCVVLRCQSVSLCYILGRNCNRKFRKFLLSFQQASILYGLIISSQQTGVIPVRILLLNTIGYHNSNT